MNQHVDYSSWVIIGYRLMRTVQVCQNCGLKHIGSVASEPYVISQRGVNGRYEERSDKISTILNRYAYYLGGKPETHMVNLPQVPCKVVDHELPVEQCVSCFNEDDWAAICDGLKLLPLAPATPFQHEGNTQGEPKKLNVNMNNKKSTKAKPKPVKMSLADLGKGLF